MPHYGHISALPVKFSASIESLTLAMVGFCIGFHFLKTASASAAVGRNVPQIIAPPARSRATKPLNALGCGVGLLVILGFVLAGQDDKAA